MEQKIIYTLSVVFLIINFVFTMVGITQINQHTTEQAQRVETVYKHSTQNIWKTAILSAVDNKDKTAKEK